jgi:hypothetical protein
MSELGKARFGQMLPGRDYVGPSKEDPIGKQASEYGGVGGLIQPPPHEVSTAPREQLMMMYNTDSGDQTGVSGSELPFETTLIKPGSGSRQKAPTPSSQVRE